MTKITLIDTKGPLLSYFKLMMFIINRHTELTPTSGYFCVCIKNTRYRLVEGKMVLANVGTY